jgi:DNA-binding transcriptional MerR regulator
MTIRQYAIVSCRTRRDDRLTLDDLASRAEVHPLLVERYIELGLLEPIEPRASTLLFDPSAIYTLRVIRRLRQGLGINVAGVAVVLELVERLRSLQRENENLRRKLSEL